MKRYIVLFLLISTPVLAGVTKIDDKRVRIEESIVTTEDVSLQELLNRKTSLEKAIQQTQDALQKLQQQRGDLNQKIAQARALGVSE